MQWATSAKRTNFVLRRGPHLAVPFVPLPSSPSLFSEVRKMEKKMLRKSLHARVHQIWIGSQYESTTLWVGAQRSWNSAWMNPEELSARCLVQYSGPFEKDVLLFAVRDADYIGTYQKTRRVYHYYKINIMHCSLQKVSPRTALSDYLHYSYFSTALFWGLAMWLPYTTSLDTKNRARVSSWIK